MGPPGGGRSTTRWPLTRLTSAPLGAEETVAGVGRPHGGTGATSNELAVWYEEDKPCPGQ